MTRRRRLCDEFYRAGRRTLAVKGNVADPASVDEMFECDSCHYRADRHCGQQRRQRRAQAGPGDDAQALALVHGDQCAALNLLAQRACRRCRQAARIIALSSLGASRAMPGYGFVGASKAALESLVRTLAQELGRAEYGSTPVSAGVVDTEALGYFPNRTRAARELCQRTPAGPTLSPRTSPARSTSCVLPEAGMINGHTLSSTAASASRADIEARHSHDDRLGQARSCS